MKKRYLVLVIVLAFGAIFMILIRDAAAPTVQNTDPFVESSLIPETLPAQKDDLIVLESPLPQSTVSSPIVIKGKARGNWYFEGSFPVTLTDAAGKVLVESYATAQGEWMTTEYVPFTTTLKYTLPVGTTSMKGYLILKKNNPSGETKFDNSLRIPITIF
jgi:hypothetical protein